MSRPQRSTAAITSALARQARREAAAHDVQTHPTMVRMRKARERRWRGRNWSFPATRALKLGALVLAAAAAWSYRSELRALVDLAHGWLVWA